MHRKDMWAVVAYLIPTVGLLLQGLLYVTTPRFMSYHADALGTTWEELPANYRGFMLGVLKAMGAGSVAVTVALLIMILIPFRRGQAWARWAVPVVGVLFTALTLYGALTIATRTPASPPWLQTCGLIALLYLLGALITYWPTRRETL
jgi:hypothetical protein